MRRGFTLTELMISIALALLLVAGVSQVFTLTSDTLSAGMAVSDRIRQEQSVKQLISDDLDHTVHDAPFLAIVSGVTPSHPNANAFDNGDAATEYRTDRLITFARYNYRRQTGNDGQLIAPYGGGEWYIWWGHPTVDGQAPGNGTPTSNRENYAASSWRLARAAILMDPEPEGALLDDNNQPQRHLIADPAKPLSPFSFDSTSDDGAFTLPQFRYDIARASIGNYRATVQHSAEADANWWQAVTDFRFDVTPYFARPLTSEAASATVPMVAENVSSFIVEFAGDWVTQDDTTGNITVLESDGVVDFIVDTDGVKSWRWYGMHRDLDGDGTADVVPVGTFAGTVPSFEKLSTATDYVAVWGDSLLNRPRYLRVIIHQTDPYGRLAVDGVMEVVSEIQ